MALESANERTVAYSDHNQAETWVEAWQASPGPRTWGAALLLWLKGFCLGTADIIPGVSGKIVYKELATPRSMSRWTLNQDGAIMGWTYDRYQCHLAKTFVQFRTPLENLFNAGHYAVWPGGVVNSAMTGRIVARGIYHGFWKQFLRA